MFICVVKLSKNKRQSSCVPFILPGMKDFKLVPTLSPLSPVERGNEVEKTNERRNFTEIYTDCDWLLLARENAKLCNNQSEMLQGSRSLLGNSREFLA